MSPCLDLNSAISGFLLVCILIIPGLLPQALLMAINCHGPRCHFWPNGPHWVSLILGPLFSVNSVASIVRLGMALYTCEKASFLFTFILESFSFGDGNPMMNIFLLRKATSFWACSICLCFKVSHPFAVIFSNWIGNVLIVNENNKD